MAIERPKGDIIGKSKLLLQKGTASTKKWYVGTGKPKAIKVGKKAAKSYAKYGKPSVTLGKRILKWGVVKPAKLALKFPGPTLVAAGLYAGAKHLGKKWGRGYHYPEVRQFDKKGRKIL
jgi:hypothetical protein